MSKIKFFYRSEILRPPCRILVLVYEKKKNQGDTKQMLITFRIMDAFISL